MRDEEKTKEQLIAELAAMRQQINTQGLSELERQRFQKKLRMLEKAFETMQIGVTIADTEGKIIYTNPAEANMHGYRVGELIGKDVKIFSPPKLWKPMTLEQIKGMKRWKRESINIRKDGKTFPVQVMSDVVTDGAGNSIGIVTSCEDITERKRSEEVRLLMKTAEVRAKTADKANLELKNEIAERERAEVALQKSEARFRAIFDAAAIGIVIVDLDGRVIESNRAMQVMLGYSAKELRNMVFSELTYRKDTGTNRRLFREVFEMKRDHYQMEKLYNHKDGSLIWGNVTISIVRNVRGKPEFTVGMVENITERKRAEEALKQSEEWMTAIFESSRDGILVEENELIIYMNKSYAHLLGYDGPEELIGKHISTILSPEDNERMLEFGRNRLQGKAVPSSYEFNGKRKDGTLIDLEASVSTSTIAGKAYIITVARDITERKRLEEQLRQSQKMEAIGQLAGGVAHDFNNLLTVIIALSDKLLRKPDSITRLYHHVEEIKKAGERAASLTHQLLAFSRRQMLQPQALDINSVVADMNKMLRRLIGEDIELITALGTALGCVKADRSQIEQVILNLVINARDAMPMGGSLVIEITNIHLDVAQIKRSFTIEPGMYVILRVSDTGSGMDAETLSHIFEPFFTTKEQGKGTGLGLSTVYGIIKQSGGYIEVLSKPGQGTTFEIYLPQVEEPIDLIKPGGYHTKPSKATETILLVEDEAEVRELTVYLLKDEGYKVLEARDGLEALQVCKQYEGTIQLMITDVVMPQMNGRELAKQVKELSPNTTVLYMSGYIDKAVGILEEGAYFLEKPFSADALVCKVREVLDGQVS